MDLTYENGAAIRDKMMTNSASAVVSAWYDQYGTDILRLCFMYLRNRSDAEDATQDPGSCGSPAIPVRICFGKAGGNMRNAQSRQMTCPLWEMLPGKTEI